MLVDAHEAYIEALKARIRIRTAAEEPAWGKLGLAQMIQPVGRDSNPTTVKAKSRKAPTNADAAKKAADAKVAELELQGRTGALLAGALAQELITSEAIRIAGAKKDMAASFAQ